MKSSGRCFLKKLCFRRDQGCTLCWWLSTVVWKSSRWCWFGRNEESIMGNSIEAWHCVEVWSSWRKPRRGFKSKWSLVAAVLGIPVAWGDHQEQQQQRSGARVSLGDNLCVLQRMEPEKWPQVLWRSPEDHEWIPDIVHGVIYMVGVWFCFVLSLTVPWFFSFEVRKHLT